MSNKRILVVEDDSDLAELLSLHLSQLGYEVEHAADGEAGLKLALDKSYALVVLDWMLPKLEGLEVCKQLRAKKARVPILMLTSRAEEMDKVLGLELGADDYVSKPFLLAELLARVKALLRRTELNDTTLPIDRPKEDLTFSDIKISPSQRKVFVFTKDVELTAKEFDLLYFLASSPGRAFTREQILVNVWDTECIGYEHSVNTLIKRLRKKIEKDPANPERIETVRGIGYRFNDPA